MLRTTFISVLLAVSLAGCGGMQEKLSRINEPPPQSKSAAATMPMPEPVPDIRMANSLWSTNRTTFFKDQRARAIGDILTVLVTIADKAELDNETKSSRDTTTGANATAVAGLESYLGKVLPGPSDPTNLA
jgi:flagellar L-ring protein precursor FlgH